MEDNPVLGVVRCALTAAGFFFTAWVTDFWPIVFLGVLYFGLAVGWVGLWISQRRALKERSG